MKLTHLIHLNPLSDYLEQNLTTWPTGWAFMLAWLSPIWTISCFDSCMHMSEEASNAAKAVPYGILMATGSTWILGFILCIVIAFCADPNFANLAGTATGQPMAQIYYDALGKNGALGFMSLLMICQFLMGLSTVSIFHTVALISLITC